MNLSPAARAEEVRRLHELGVPNTRIGRRLGIHRNTVHAILSRPDR